MYAYVLAINGGVYLAWQTYLINRNSLKNNMMLSRENIRQG